VKDADHTMTKADEFYSFEREDSEVNLSVNEFDDNYVPEAPTSSQSELETPTASRKHLQHQARVNLTGMMTAI